MTISSEKKEFIMSNEKSIKEEILKLRGLFRIAGEGNIAINATDDEIKSLYDMQNKSIKLYNQSIALDINIFAIKKKILKRTPFKK